MSNLSSPPSLSSLLSSLPISIPRNFLAENPDFSLFLQDVLTHYYSSTPQQPNNASKSDNKKPSSKLDYTSSSFLHSTSLSSSSILSDPSSTSSSSPTTTPLSPSLQFLLSSIPSSQSHELLSKIQQLNTIKSSYFKQQLLYQMINNRKKKKKKKQRDLKSEKLQKQTMMMREEKENGNGEKEEEEEEKRMRNETQELLAIVQSTQHLDLPSSSSASRSTIGKEQKNPNINAGGWNQKNMLGLKNANEMLAENQVAERAQALQPLILPWIEQQIQQLHQSLPSYYPSFSTSSTSSSISSSSTTSSFSSRLERDLSSLHSLSSRLSSLNSSHFSSLLSLASSSLQLLHLYLSLIKEYKLNLIAGGNKVKCKWMKEKVEVLCCKMELIKEEMEVRMLELGNSAGGRGGNVSVPQTPFSVMSTPAPASSDSSSRPLFTPSIASTPFLPSSTLAVPTSRRMEAVRLLRQELDRHLTSIREEWGRLKQLANEYERVGEREMQALVKEWVEVKEKIANREWSLSQFQ